MQNLQIETVTIENVDDLGFFCIGSKKHPGYVSKRAWLEKRFKEGLHILYTMQCPYTGKIVRELPDVARRHNIVLNLWEIDDPAEAREIMPSPYGTFALIHDGRLLEDHPISTTRFRNILQRELNLSESSL